MSIEDTWLVAICAGRFQVHGIREAQALGIKVIAIDANKDAEGFQIADLSLTLELTDETRIIRELRNLNLPIRGAVSFCSEAGMPLAARVRAEFGLTGPDAELTKRLTNKSLQRKIWTESHVPGPIWKLFGSADVLNEAIRSSNLPVIIKPSDSSGSRGVTKIESLEDDIAGAIARAFSFSKSGEVLLESYMDGTEFTVETFGVGGVIHVLAVTEKKKVAGTRGTVAQELATPARPPHVVRAIQECVVQAFKALGYNEGPGHTEVILMHDGNVGVVEVAGRGGGFLVFEKLVPAASGINIAKYTILQAVGLPVPELVLKPADVVLRFSPSSAGVLKEIRGMELANGIEGVEAGAFVKIGSACHAAVSDGERLGYILSKSSTPEKAQMLADQAERCIEYVVVNEN